jgi:hypothetical protein
MRLSRFTERRARLRLGEMLGVVVVGLLVTAVPPANAEVVPDANCPGPVTGPASSGVDARWAENFTALHTGSLVRGETEIGKTGATGDFAMQILATDSAGDPTNTVLASTTIPDASVPIGDSRIAGVFATPANVVAGQRYAFVITRPGAEFTVRDANNNPCPDGAEYLSVSQTAVWSGADTCCDLVFALFVEVPQTSPPPPSNAFTLHKVVRNEKKGTATLTVRVPGPGELTGSGGGVKAASVAQAVTSKAVAGPGDARLLIKAKGKKRRKLNETGKVKLNVAVTFTPNGGNPSTKTVRVKLVRRILAGS